MLLAFSLLGSTALAITYSWASDLGGFFVMGTNADGTLDAAYYSGAIHDGATAETYWPNLTEEAAGNLFEDMSCDLESIREVDDQLAEKPISHT